MKVYLPEPFQSIPITGENDKTFSSSDVSPLNQEDPELTYYSQTNYYIPTSSSSSDYSSDGNTAAYYAATYLHNTTLEYLPSSPMFHTVMPAGNGTFTTTPSPASSTSISSYPLPGLPPDSFCTSTMYPNPSSPNSFMSNDGNQDIGSESDKEMKYDTKANACAQKSLFFASEENEDAEISKEKSFRYKNKKRRSAHSNNGLSNPGSNKKKKDGTVKSPSYGKPSSTNKKNKKRCTNCLSTHAPSWRRSIAKSTRGKLLCNACGLYERTAQKKRMLVTTDDGKTKVVRNRNARDYFCAICHIKNITRWRLVNNIVQCEHCARKQ